MQIEQPCAPQILPWSKVTRPNRRRAVTHRHGVWGHPEQMRRTPTMVGGLPKGDEPAI